MRRAAFSLLLCVSVTLVPAAFSAATDTNSGAGAAVTKNAPAAVIPPTTAQAQTATRSKLARPGSATLSNIQDNDPHPLLTEFFGPAPRKTPKDTAPKLPAPQAKLIIGPAE